MKQQFQRRRYRTQGLFLLDTIERPSRELAPISESVRELDARFPHLAAVNRLNWRDDSLDVPTSPMARRFRSI